MLYALTFSNTSFIDEALKYLVRIAAKLTHSSPEWCNSVKGDNLIILQHVKVFFIYHTLWSAGSGFDLAWFSSLSSHSLCIFGLHGAIYIYDYFLLILYFTFLWTESGEIGPWPGWLTIVLQCYATVGLVIWPIKASLIWSILCQVGCQLHYTILYLYCGAVLLALLSLLFYLLKRQNGWYKCEAVWQCTPCPRKKGATDFFAITFINIDGFS